MEETLGVTTESYDEASFIIAITKDTRIEVAPTGKPGIFKFCLPDTAKTFAAVNDFRTNSYVRIQDLLLAKKYILDKLMSAKRGNKYHQFVSGANPLIPSGAVTREEREDGEGGNPLVPA